MNRTGFKKKPEGSIELVCLVCGKRFKVFPHRALKSKVCSYQCAGEVRRTQVERICKNCGSKFMFAPSQLNAYKGAGQYCSQQCSYQGQIVATRTKPSRDRYQRTNRTDDKNWKAAVRARDDFTCQRCGTKDPYIHTHHVAPRSRRPDLKHDVSNGKCLCNACHTWVHNHPREATELGLLSTATYELAHPKTPFCHDEAELQGEAKMQPIILNRIAQRGTQIEVAA